MTVFYMKRNTGLKWVKTDGNKQTSKMRYRHVKYEATILDKICCQILGAEAFLELTPTSMMEFFCKNS